MSGMILTNNEQGGINVLLIPLVLAILFFFGAVGFGLWAFTERSDYKNNTDQKVAAAVKVAEERVSSEKDNEFLESEKKPLRVYKGSSVFGNISFQYPKTWSAHQTDTNDQLTLIMHPLVISGNEGSTYALKITVESTRYEEALRQYEGNVKSGTLRASPIRLKKVNSVLGTRFDGEITQGTKGSAVVLPLRDKTMIISTESEDFIKDFNNIILPNYNFVP